VGNEERKQGYKILEKALLVTQPKVISPEECDSWTTLNWTACGYSCLLDYVGRLGSQSPYVRSQTVIVSLCCSNASKTSSFHLKKKRTALCFLPYVDTVRRALYGTESKLHQTWNFGTVRNEFLLLISHLVYDTVISAQTNWGRHVNWWLTFVILASWEAEIRRIEV
jgi:hypothetical protein